MKDVSADHRQARRENQRQAAVNKNVEPPGDPVVDLRLIGDARQPQKRKQPVDVKRARVFRAFISERHPLRRVEVCAEIILIRTEATEADGRSKSSLDALSKTTSSPIS